MRTARGTGDPQLTLPSHSSDTPVLQNRGLVQAWRSAKSDRTGGTPKTYAKNIRICRNYDLVMWYTWLIALNYSRLFYPSTCAFLGHPRHSEVNDILIINSTIPNSTILNHSGDIQLEILRCLVNQARKNGGVSANRHYQGWGTSIMLASNQDSSRRLMCWICDPKSRWCTLYIVTTCQYNSAICG